MNVIYYNIVRRRDIEDELNIKYYSFLDLLKEFDFVSIHVPLTDVSYHMIGEKELARAPPLIKAAVDAFPSFAHPDLVEALRRKIPGRELGVSMLGPGAVLLVIALSVSFTGLGAWMAGNPTFGATTKSVIEVLCYVCGMVLSALGLYFLRREV